MPLSKSETHHIEILLAGFDRTFSQRGLVLYKQGSVKYDFFDENVQSFQFKVRGNIEPYYDVDINLNGQPTPDFFSDYDDEPFLCTCMAFEEEGECKHVAAVLHFMLANKKSDFKKYTPVVPISSGRPEEISFPIEIPCREEDLQRLHELIPVEPNIRIYETYLRQVDFLENGLRYVVDGYNFKATVVVTYIDDKIIIDGNHKKPHSIKQTLKWFQERLLRYNNWDAHCLTQKQRDKSIIESVKELGVYDQLKNPLKAYEFIFDQDEIIMVTSGELKGLMDLDALSYQFKEHFRRDALLHSRSSITHSHQESEIGVYNPGFALAYSYYNNFFQVIPFMAKGSKHDPTAFKVKFEKIEDPYDIRLSKTENLERAMYQIAKIDKAIQKQNQLDIFGQFRQFLEIVNDYPLFVFLGDPYESRNIRKSHFDKPLEVHDAKAVIRMTKTGVLYNLEVQITFGEHQIKLSEKDEKLDVTLAFAVYLKMHLLKFQHQKVLQLLSFLKNFPHFQVLEKDFDPFFQNILLPMAHYIEIQDETGTLKQAENTGPLQKQLYISELTGLVIFRPQVKYSDAAFSNPLEGSSIIDADTKRIYLRDEEFEEEFLEFVRDLHPNFKHAGSQGFFHLTHDVFMQGLWFFKAFERLKSHQVRVFGLENIKIKKYNPFPPVVSLEFGSSQDWFEVQANVAFGDQKVKLRDIKKALDRDQEFIELEDGSLGILPEKWMKKFGKLFRSGDTDKNNFKVPKTLFHILDEFEEAKSFPEIIKEIEEKKEKLKSFTEIKNAKVPKKLKAELRNYQHTGLNWLNFLQEYKWGGILADDMGLGKTLQMIALICKMVESNKKAKILVVAPTTLLFNWKNELEKFAPHLDYFIHHGNRYDSADELGKHQVILTSYGLVINDLELLRKIHFDAIIADESQAIKNTQSLRYKAITKLNGKIKMAMTGTPIENSLAELFAQMNFVNPGFFHSFNSFKENYLKPLKNGNKEILTELQNKIKPFVLRRTKEEVLTELPDKTEEYLYCVMNPIQRKIYDAYRNEYRDYLLKKIEEEGAENSKMYVLEGLTKLRLACDATNLVNHTEAKNESVKIDLLIEHILEKTGNHKILIFSQFVKMLSLVQTKLEENLIDYAYLDGSTTLKNREKVVQQFQNEEKKRVFLISLKAGGTGLNLTAADYVYVLDPWWNPAVENQAIDRCYRMGQEKHVIAYRMICKDTVEEKIMQLQQAKSKLAKEVIAEGDSFLGALDKDSMLVLFE
ncbi:SNF2-related protein [Aquiflexum sp.]|uniref:SNF2-related protein n=1 Tax=Aquiflexum sp. TaxID=1872584 RepID=UPI00359490E3